ncbi:hypothetical protein AAVH_29610 [Aphelenchoides avenae]|nr:hypothetical protein AAVH_29610 [Aphelenchus avenae]
MHQKRQISNLAVTVIVDTGRNSREPDDQLCKIERDAEEMKEMREKEMRERFKDIVGLSNLDAEIVKRRVAHLEQATDRVRSESQLEAGSQAISSRAAAYFALLLRPKRHYTGSMPLLLLLLLVSSTAVVQARKRGQEPEEPQVIKEKFRIVPEQQSPANWRTWTNRGSDCVLMTTVWQFLVLPEAPDMLKRCDGPLCKMLKSVAKKKRLIFGPKRFTKCYRLAQLLGYNDIEAAGGADGYPGIPTMARLLLTLSHESAEIKERFEAVSDVTRFCDVMVLAFIQTH